MSAYKTDQRHVRHRGRDFHFVSYEGHGADPKRHQEATPATWYLMAAGKRWAVIPQHLGQTPEDLDRCLIDWLEVNVFGRVARRA